MIYDIWELIDKGITLLLKYGKDNSGSFYQQEIGVPGKPVAPTLANIILALHKTGKINGDELETYINNLLKLKDEKSNLFCRNEGLSSWATSKALITLLTVRPDLVKPDDILALIRLQNKDGGWGYREEYTSRPFYTYFAVKSLVLFFEKMSEIRKELIQSLRKAKSYLLSIWDRINKGNETDPITILFTIGSLKLLEDVLNEKIVNENMLSKSYLYIKKDLETSDIQKWSKYSFGESGAPFHIQITPADILPVILEVYGKEEISTKLIKLLCNTARRYMDAVGWCPLGCDKNEKPYTWTTALAILSLYEWITTPWKHSPTVKKEHVVDFMREEAKLHGFNLIKTSKLKILLAILILSTLLNLLCIYFLFGSYIYASRELFIWIIIYICTIIYVCISLYYRGDIKLRDIWNILSSLKNWLRGFL